MGKGYAEGPAAEEAEAARDRGDHLARPGTAETRRVVFGWKPDTPTHHRIGYADEVDPDERCAAGKAWGIKVVNAVE